MISPHPERKKILEAIAPHIEAGREFYSYEELEAITGIDCQSLRGRRQFLAFRKDALERFSVWFENERDKGYRMVKPNEHVDSASLRVKRAHRLQKRALAIVTNTRWESLTDHEKTKALSAQAIIGSLVQAGTEAVKRTRRISGEIELPKLASAAVESMKV